MFINTNRTQKGQGLVEYALILVLVAVVVIGVLLLLGPVIGNVFSKVNSNISGMGAGGGGTTLSQALSRCEAAAGTTEYGWSLDTRSHVFICESTYRDIPSRHELFTLNNVADDTPQMP